MYIIIKGKTAEQERFKGKTITEFAKNLESEGWPTEFANEEMRDRVKHIEKKERRPLKKFDIPKLAREMGILSKRKKIERIGKEMGLIKFDSSYPDPKK